MTRGSKAGHRSAASLVRVAFAGLSTLWLVSLMLMPMPASAQSDAAPRIVVAETIAAAAASQAPVRISITPPTAIPRNAFVRIRGLPQMAALSEGHAIAPGAWAVSLAALADLRVTVPATAQGRSALTITLVSVDGAVIAETQTTLVIGASAPAAAPALPSAPLRAAPAEQSAAAPVEGKAAVAALKPEDRERALRLVKRGQQYLQESNVAEARLLFEKAADLGLAEAAMALAATFDEAELTKSGVRGVKPEPKEARRWYERAAQLGAREAQQHLQRLGEK